MAEQISVDPALLQRMVGFIGAAGEQLQKKAADREQAQKVAAEAVDALVQKGLLGEERKQAAVDLLTDDHVKALDTLRRTATHVKAASAEATPPSLGKPAEGQTKKASTDLEEADQKFLAALGWAQ
jgi:hypothetical protein